MIYPAKFGIDTTYSQTYLGRLAEIRAEARPAHLVDSVCQRQLLVVADTRNEHCVFGRPRCRNPQGNPVGRFECGALRRHARRIAKRSGFRFRNIEVASCPPIEADPAAVSRTAAQRACEASLGCRAAGDSRFPVIIVSASWTTYASVSDAFLSAVFDTARAFAASGKLVIMVGKAPELEGYDARCPGKALSYPWLACPDLVVADG